MPDQWFYAQSGQQKGPISIDALRQLIAAGSLRPTDLVWREGMANWTALQSVPELTPPPPAPAAAPGQAPYPQAGYGQPYGYQPGQQAPGHEQQQGGYGQPYAPSGYAQQQAPYGQPYPQQPYTYSHPYGQGAAQPLGYYTHQGQFPGFAGFWKRFAAAFIDGLLMAVIIYPLSFGIYAAFGVSFQEMLAMQAQPGRAAPPGFWAAYFINVVINVSIAWLYSAMMESSSRQATLGKMALGIVVTDEQGQRITFGQASGRHFGKILSGLICLIGFIMAGFTERKQALHDMMAGTLVINKP
jgi:uncharacterized RDD family membrane protein YckC